MYILDFPNHLSVLYYIQCSKASEIHQISVQNVVWYTKIDAKAFKIILISKRWPCPFFYSIYLLSLPDSSIQTHTDTHTFTRNLLHNMLTNTLYISCNPSSSLPSRFRLRFFFPLSPFWYHLWAMCKTTVDCAACTVNYKVAPKIFQLIYRATVGLYCLAITLSVPDP